MGDVIVVAVMAVLGVLTGRGWCSESFTGMPLPECWFECPTCDDNSRSPSLFATCQCDAACPYFGDCCYNYFQKCLDMRYEDLINFLYEIKRLKTSPQASHNSVSRTARYSSCTLVHQNFLYTINKCPEIFGDDVIRQRCENQFRAFPFDVPVTNRWNTNELFANIFCALCHVVPRHNMIVWDSELRCSDPCDVELCGPNRTLAQQQHLATRAMKRKYCRTYVSQAPSHSQNRPCNANVPAAICFENTTFSDPTNPRNITPSDIVLLCDSYIFTLGTFESDDVYRNVHCLTCIKNQRFNMSELKCMRQGTTVTVSGGSRIIFTANISAAAMTYSFANQQMKLVPPSLTCNESQTANALLGRCEDNPCEEHTRVNTGRNGCVVVYEPDVDWSKSDIHLMLRIHLSVPFEVIVFSKIALILERTTATGLAVTQRYGRSGLNTSLTHVSLAVADTESELKPQYVQYVATMAVNTQESTADIVQMMQILFIELKRLTKPPIYLDKMVLSKMETPERVICPAERKLRFTNLPVVKTDEHMYVLPDTPRGAISLEKTLFSVDLENQFGVFHLQEVTICLNSGDIDNITRSTKEILNCPKMTFTEQEYTIDNNELTIGDRVVPEDMYVLNETVVLLCQDTVKSLLSEQSFAVSGPSYGIFKTVSLATAEVCTVLTISIQLLRRDYKDDHGRLYLVLMFTFAIVFGFDLADRVIDFLARLLSASILHFLWLAVVFLNTSRAVLLLQHARTKTSYQAKLILYLFISTIIPLAIVLICIVLEQGPPAVEIGYGTGVVVWWMGSWPALLVTCAAPCGLLVLTTTGIHAHVFWASRNCSNSSRTRFRSGDGLVLTSLLGLLLSVGCSAERYTYLASLGYIYYALHVAIAFSFLQNQVTCLIIRSTATNELPATSFSGIDENSPKRQDGGGAM